MAVEHTLYTGEESTLNAIYLKCFQKSLRPLYKKSPFHQNIHPLSSRRLTLTERVASGSPENSSGFLPHPVLSQPSLHLSAAGSLAKSAT